MVILTLMGVTDSAGHSGLVTVREVEKIVRDRDDDEAVLYFNDGRTLSIRTEDADRLLKCIPGLESVESKI